MSNNDNDNTQWNAHTIANRADIDSKRTAERTESSYERIKRTIDSLKMAKEHERKLNALQESKQDDG